MAHLAIALFATSLAIHFTTVPKEDIERRLRAVENTNFKRELQLRSLFEEAGCKGDRLTEQRVKHAQAPNVICTLPGSTGSVIVVGAHFDFVDSGEGVVDNWSGCSLLPSFFQSLKASPGNTRLYLSDLRTKRMAWLDRDFTCMSSARRPAATFRPW